MSLFSINCNLNLIYVLVYWIMEIFIRLAMYYNSVYFSLSEKSQAENEYMYIIFPVFSKLLSGFLIIYVHCVSNDKSKGQKELKSKLIYIKPTLKNTKLYYYRKLLFITFLELFTFSLPFIFFLIIEAKRNEVSNKILWDINTFLDILVRYIFSIIILKIKMHKHHLWSVYGILIGFIIVVPFDICDVYFQKNIKTMYTFIYIGILSIRSITYPLEGTYIKKFFNTYYVLPEYLLFSIAVVETILLLIITPILYFTKVLKFEFTIGSEVIIMIIIYILTTAVREYIFIKIIYLFSSQSVSFLIISQPLAYAIKDIINFFLTKDKSDIHIYYYISFPFQLIAIFIIIISTLVYDEIIIVNKWGLNINVKKGIIERAQYDASNSNIEDIETLNDINDDGDTETCNTQIQM